MLASVTIMRILEIGVNDWSELGGGEREREREGERELETLFYKDCSLGSVKNLSNI